MEQEPVRQEMQNEHHFEIPKVTERPRRIDFRFLEGLVSIVDNPFYDDDTPKAA